MYLGQGRLCGKIRRPGCQKACSTVTRGRVIGKELDSSIFLRSLYDPQTDKVTIEWNRPKETEIKGSVLYAVLLREKNDNSQEWDELSQTTSHVIKVKRGLLGRDTDIRLVAANATGQVTDIVTSYLDSLVAEPDNSISSSIDYEEDEDVPQIIHHSGRWRPHLLSIRQTHKSLGVQATVTWPLIRSPGAAKYEVSWNVIDDTIEITGHLQTSSNVAVLTLWPNALYSVQINAYVDNEDPVTKSEPLVIDTRLEKPAMGVSSAPLQCRDNQNILIASLFVIVLFTTFAVIVACCCKCAMSRRNKSSCTDESAYSDEAYPVKDSMGKIPVSQSISSLQGPHSPVGESQEQLLKCSVHGPPYVTTSRPLHTHINLGNAL